MDSKNNILLVEGHHPHHFLNILILNPGSFDSRNVYVWSHQHPLKLASEYYTLLSYDSSQNSASRMCLELPTFFIDPLLTIDHKQYNREQTMTDINKLISFSHASLE